MSDESAKGTGDQPNNPDQIKNFKAEVDRKLDSVRDEVLKANQALMAQIQALTPKAPKPASDDISKLIYDDPKQYTQKVKEMAKDEIRAEQAALTQAQAKTNAVLNQLVYDYPELQSESNELTKKATKLYMEMDPSERQSPMAYKLAVKEAAEDLGIKPRSKRKDDDEPYSVSSSSSPSSSPKSQKGGKTKLAPETLTFAKLVGMNIEDPKVVERLEKRQRDNWTRYK